MSTEATIVDPKQAYSPTVVVIDRPTDDLVDFVAACEELRRRNVDAHEAQIELTRERLERQLAAERRQLGTGALRETARWQVFYQRRRSADQELGGMQPASQFLQDADAHDDTELYRRRERALELLLDDEAVSYARLLPEVLVDRERACRQQAKLVDDQNQLTRQLARLRGVRGLLGQRRVRQLNAELRELDRQLEEVQTTIRHQQALLDAIQAADINRQAWLAEHRATLHQGAAAVIELTRRLLALANPPGCTQPVREVDLDHPMGRDPLGPPRASNGGTSPAPAGEDARVASAAATRVAAPSPADPPGQG
jgi:hypothetical protein